MANDLTNTNDAANIAPLNGYTNAANQPMQSGTKSANDANTVVGVFNSRDNAEKAVKALRSQGFTSEEINIISQKTTENTETEDNGGFYDDDVSDGAMTGGAVGGLGGLLLGAGALAIPGIAPIIAAGPIAAALGGAVAGGIAGGLIDWGIPAEAGERYEQHVAQGGILAIVRTTDSKKQQAAQILRQYDAQDVESHMGK